MVKVPPPAQFRKSRRSKKQPYSPPAAGPVLMAAVLVMEDNQVVLTFDQPINIDALVGSAITVANGPAGIEFAGMNNALLQNPTTVGIELEYVGIAAGSNVLLTVTSENGITSVSGGVAWAGVSALSLPFGG